MENGREKLYSTQTFQFFWSNTQLISVKFFILFYIRDKNTLTLVLGLIYKKSIKNSQFRLWDQRVMILSLAGGTGMPLFLVSVEKPIGAVVLVLTEKVGHTTGCFNVNISVNFASISTKLDFFHPPPPYFSLIWCLKVSFNNSKTTSFPYIYTVLHIHGVLVVHFFFIKIQFMISLVICHITLYCKIWFFSLQLQWSQEPSEQPEQI